MPIPDTPYTRKEAYLNAAATGDTSGIPETPYTREEMYLDAIARGGGGGGGSGLPPITEAGTALTAAPNMSAEPTVTIIVPEQQSTYVADNIEGVLENVNVGAWAAGSLIRVTINGNEYLTMAYNDSEFNCHVSDYLLYTFYTGYGYFGWNAYDQQNSEYIDHDITITAKVELLQYPVNAQWSALPYKHVFTGRITEWIDSYRSKFELDDPRDVALNAKYCDGPCCIILEDMLGEKNLFATDVYSGSAYACFRFDAFSPHVAEGTMYILNLDTMEVTSTRSQQFSTVQIYATYRNGIYYLDSDNMTFLEAYQTNSMELHVYLPGKIQVFTKESKSTITGDENIIFSGIVDDNGTLKLQRFKWSKSGLFELITDKAL